MLCLWVCVQIVRRPRDYKETRERSSGGHYDEPLELFLLGTAHTSLTSAQQVEQLIHEVRHYPYTLTSESPFLTRTCMDSTAATLDLYPSQTWGRALGFAVSVCPVSSPPPAVSPLFALDLRPISHAPPPLSCLVL